MDRLENKLLGIHVGCVCVSLRYFVLFWRAESVLSMVDGGQVCAWYACFFPFLLSLSCQLYVLVVDFLLRNSF